MRGPERTAGRRARLGAQLRRSLLLTPLLLLAGAPGQAQSPLPPLAQADPEDLPAEPQRATEARPAGAPQPAAETPAPPAQPPAASRWPYASPRCPPFPSATPEEAPAATVGQEGLGPEPRPALPADPLAPVSRDTSSQGTANHGQLRRSATLPLRGPHHRFLPGREARHYGTAELVEALRSAAARVATRYPGSVLLVGNMSQQAGGKIPVSVSHQSGRDVDLLFYATDGKTGRPLVPKKFLRYRGDGRSRDGTLRFDPARNWALVEALLRSPAGVQWIFVSQGLRTLLLEHARRHGAAPELIARAAQTLRQPGDSAPHDDHFHVRLHCAPDDLLDQCREYGPWRPWVPYPRQAMAARVAGLRGLLEDRGAPAPQRLTALTRLETLGQPQAAASLVAVLAEDDWELQRAALGALRGLGATAAAAGVAERLRPGAPLPLLAAGLQTLAALGSAELGDTLAPLLSDDRPLPAMTARRAPAGPTVARRTAELLGELAVTEAVPALAGVLDDEARPAELRIAARTALQRITMRETVAGAAPGASGEGRAWLAWYGAQRTAGREAWLVGGMAEAGYPLGAGACAPRTVQALLPALDDPRPFVRSNAQDMIRAVVNMPPWRAGERATDARFWQAWWARTGEPTARLTEGLALPGAAPAATAGGSSGANH